MGCFRCFNLRDNSELSKKYFRIFSAGGRDCVGQKLAMLELRFAIVKLVTEYELTMDRSFYELLKDEVDGLIIEAKDGIWLNVSPRRAVDPQST